MLGTTLKALQDIKLYNNIEEKTKQSDFVPLGIGAQVSSCYEYRFELHHDFKQSLQKKNNVIF